MGRLDAVKQQSGSLQAALDEAEAFASLRRAGLPGTQANRQSAKLSVAEHKAATAEQQATTGCNLQVDKLSGCSTSQHTIIGTLGSSTPPSWIFPELGSAAGIKTANC